MTSPTQTQRRLRPIYLAIATAVWLASPGDISARAQSDAPQSVTVSGCLEQDAASRTVIYKLIAATSNGTTIYRLVPGQGIDLAGHLGHTIEVTGALTKREVSPRGREDLEIAVRALKMVADRCR